MSRSTDVGAAQFAAVRATLKLNQGEFAERLQISRRTVIRGERRGIELSCRYRYSVGDERREPSLRERWTAALEEAQRVARGDTYRKILAEVSQRLAAAKQAQHAATAAGLPGPGCDISSSRKVSQHRRAGAPRKLSHATVSRSRKSHSARKGKPARRTKR